MRWGSPIQLSGSFSKSLCFHPKKTMQKTDMQKKSCHFFFTTKKTWMSICNNIFLLDVQWRPPTSARAIAPGHQEEVGPEADDSMIRWFSWPWSLDHQTANHLPRCTGKPWMDLDLWPPWRPTIDAGCEAMEKLVRMLTGSMHVEFLSLVVDTYCQYHWIESLTGDLTLGYSRTWRSHVNWIWLET